MQVSHRSPRVHPARRFSAVWLLSCASCATYSDRTAQALLDFEQGRFERAAEAFADDDVTGSDFLSGAEAGIVELTAGDWEGAIEQLERAAQAVEEFEAQALLSPTSAGRGVLSLAVSETALEYKGEGYERVQLHTGMALAYLAQGLLEDAMVELRRANLLLESEEKLYEKKYRAGGLGHFLSAIAYDLLGEPDQAYIDWKRLHDKGLAAAVTGPNLVHLARRLGRRQELDRWCERYGDPVPIPDDAARVILIGGVGLAPHKRAANLMIGTRSGLLQWSVPEYVDRPQPVAGLRLEVGASATPSVVVEDVAQVSRENLSDRLAWLATKSTVRAVAKREMTRALQEEHGILGRILGDLFAFATERADLRSWQSLPASWQVALLNPAAGRHDVAVRTRSGGGAAGVDLGTFELEPGETMFVFARSLGSRLYVHPVGGHRIDAPLELDASADSPRPSTNP